MLGITTIWAIILWLVRVGCTLKWDNEEQFVEGDFPYYPFNNKIYSLTDLPDDRALASDFNGPEMKGKRDTDLKTREHLSFTGDDDNKSSFYEFKKESSAVINESKANKTSKLASKRLSGKMGKSSKFGKPRSRNCRRIRRVPGRLGVKRENVRTPPEIEIGYEEKKVYLGDDWNPQPAERIADAILSNFSQSEEPGQLKSIPSSNVSQGGYEPSKLARAAVKTINGPYETNYSGGGFRYTNPSTWLAKEIEQFIRRNDYRWLDFMKNSGMETKKFDGIMIEPKHQPDQKPSKHKVIAAEESLTDDSIRSNSSALIDQIDNLLQDLSQFRATVKHKRSGDHLMDGSVRSLEGRLKPDKIREARSAPNVLFPSENVDDTPRTPSALVEKDLLALRKNIMFVEHSVTEDENSQALKDLKLHIKVYVDNGDKFSNDESNN